MDVAIVGIGCRLPGGADTPERYWDLLCRGVDAITEVPPDRFDLTEVFDPDPTAAGKIYTRWGGFVDDIAGFDAEFFGIAPREAKRIDPQHRLLLEIVWEALEDGGHLPERLAGTSTGVFIGISTHDYGDLHMAPGQRALLDAHVNIGNALCAAPNRVSYHLDLRGPSMAIESACSSSLTAVHLACRSLEAGESTLAIAGGVNVVLSPELTIGFCRATMMSPDGRCRAFDSRANGYVRSEGAGVVVLKPLAQAREDGDPIYAIVRGSAVNEDGRTAGISLPSSDAHEALLRQALRDANIEPTGIQYVEAHGTGTAAGDPVEASAIGRVFGQGRADDKPLLVGSVKTNIGHLEAGAGIAGLIKVALMLGHRQVPPSLHFDAPNPAIPFDELRLRIPTAVEPWPATTGPARAGVNSFGFGGANAHVLLEEPPEGAHVPRDPAQVEPPEHRRPPRAHVLTVSARTDQALREAAASYRDVLRTGGDLDDVCHTAAARRTHHVHRLAIVGDTPADLAAELDRYLAGEPSAVTVGRGVAGSHPKLAFVFGGMGTQWWGMGRQLMAEEPVYRRTLEQCDRALAPVSGWSLLDELAASETSSRLDETRVVQVVNCAVQIGLAALWRSWGIVPDAVVGHSAGEVAAAHVAGALTLEDALRLAYHRGRLLHRATGSGTMLAAGISADEAAELAEDHQGRVSVAAVNSVGSVTLSGDATALKAIAETLEQRELFARFLQVDVPYHGPQMDALRDDLLAALRDIEPAAATIPLTSGTTGAPVGDQLLDGAYWWRNVRQPVLFARAVDTLIADGCDLFLEISPHPALAAYLTEGLAGHGTAGTVLPSLRRNEDERETMLRSLAALHVRGRPVDWSAVSPDGACVRLPTYPWQRERHWFEPAGPATVRTGIDTGHPLLGRRLPTAHPVWERDLADPRCDFLDAHRIEDSAVFPGAAYVELALAAARQLHGDTGLVVLEGVEFRRLLFLPPGRELTLQVLSHPSDDAVEILSTPRDDASSWTLHATAVLRPPVSGPAPSPIDLDALRARCVDEVPVADHYRTFAAYGYRYGAPFRGLAQTWDGGTEALAHLRFPDDGQLPVTAFQVHPALLDAGFQLLVAMAAGGSSNVHPLGPLFPVSIGRVTSHRPACERLWAHVRVRRADPDVIEGDLTLTDAAGEVMLVCDQLRLEALDEDRSGPSATTHDWLYELRWEPAPLPSSTRRVSRLRPAPDIKELLERGEGPEQTRDLATYHEVVAPTLDHVATGFAAAALDALGWDPNPGRAHLPDDEAAAVGVVPQHRRLFAAVTAHVRAAAASDPTAVGSVDRHVLHGRLDALATDVPAFAAEAELLRLGGDRLAEVLRGDVDPREVLLGDVGLGLLERLYHHSPPSRAYHELLGDAVAAAVALDDPTRSLRVVEVGAGTGAATAAILARLPESAEYLFTDISPHFLPAARRRFDDPPTMRLDVLDIERDPTAQGFEAHSVDIVVAANVLHATADLRSTLGNVERLLTPGGLLVVLELAAPAPWFLLVFGLLDGWWRFQDTDVRPSQSLLGSDGWTALLEDCGFERVATPFDAGGRKLQTLLLAHTPSAVEAHAAAAPDGPVRITTPADHRSSSRAGSSWLLFADEGGVASRLAAALRRHDGTCRVVRRGGGYHRHADGTVELPPDDPSAMQQLVDDLRAADTLPEGVIHLWSLDTPDGDDLEATDLLTSQALGSESVLALAQALARLGDAAPSLWLVTAGAQTVGPEDPPPRVAQTPLWGLGRVLMNEQTVTRCHLVDLGPACTDEEVAALADEIHDDGSEQEVAIRNGGRHVCRVRRAAPSDAALPEPTMASADHDAFRLEIDEVGKLETLVLRSLPAMEPGPDEVAIRVRAAGLGFRDVLKALGMLPEAALAADPDPQVLGVECSGVVLACGDDVTEFEPGDEVVALGWGAQASRMVTSANLVVAKPPNATFTEAASLANAFVTADYALHEVARVRAGERVLIHSAAGAVGLAAVQICRDAGVEVFATAGTEEKRAHLAALGVPHVMDSRSLEFADVVRERTSGEGVDVVLNSLGGEAMRASLELLRPYGRFVELGKRDIYDNARIGLLPFQHNLTYTAVDLLQLALDRPATAKRLLARAMEQVADGTYLPVPCTAFDLMEVEEAFRFMAQARHIGKVVLSVAEPHYPVQPARDGSPVRSDATYLVTGGLGGFGLAVAAWLVQQGARTLVLMSRSGVPKGSEHGLEALRASDADVRVVTGDVASGQDVAAVLAQIADELPPLRGVVHAAMVLDDDALTRLDPGRFRAVLAPKMAGAWNLHRLTRGMSLDFFVLFSSIASVVGHPMQGNYAAANAFLDAFAAYRHRLGLPGLTVGWGAVADVGYVARHPDVADYLQRGGFRGFTPQQALDTLDRLLRTDAEHVVAAQIDWAILVDANPMVATSQRFAPLLAERGDIGAEGVPKAGTPLSLVRDAPEEERPAVLEQYLAERVAKVLGSAPERVDRDRPLTDLGFDSLMAVELTSAIKTDLGVRLPVVKVLQGGSCRALAETLADHFTGGEDEGGEDEGDVAGEATDAETPAAATYPLSPEQRRLWFLHRLEPDNPAYNIPMAAGLSGPLDVDALERSLRAAVERHEILCATFQDVDGEPVQSFTPTSHVALPTVDLSGLPDPHEALQHRATEMIREPFELERGPLVRATLFRLEPGEHVLVVVVHHIACDAWSVNHLAREIAAGYEACAAGRPVDLPPPPSRYLDYVHRERTRLDEELVADQLGYWKRQLAGVPTLLALPEDERRGSHIPPHGAHEPFRLSPGLTAGLETLGREEGATLFMTLLAAFQALLHRYCGADDICVGTPVATRAPDEEAVVGCFMNTLVLRTDLSGGPTFRELLQRARRTTLEAFQHKDVPFERVVEAVRPLREAGHTPLFQAMLVLHNARLPDLRLAGLDLRAVEVESGTAVTDLVLLLDSGDGLSGTLEYNADRFDPPAARRLLAHFETLLEGIVADPDRPLSRLPLLTASEQHTLLAEWTHTAADLGAPRCIHDLVATQARATPDAVAVRCGTRSLTYAELEARANQLAHHLGRHGVGPDLIVAVLMDRSIETVAALLAVLKAGGAYLPLDPTHPQARLRLQLEDARVAAVLTQEHLAAALPAGGTPVVVVDTEWGRIGLEPVEAPPETASADDLAYVLYTSGSTGQPKGVLIEHRAVCNHLRWRQRAIPLDHTDVVVQRTPLTFDPSVWEMFGPLTSGARLVLPPPDTDDAGLLRLVAAEGITTLQAVPSALEALLDLPELRACRSLRRVICGGEPLSADLQERVFARLEVELHHVYGPTEATIETTHWRCLPGSDPAIVPVGRPIDNVTVYILDDQLQPVPVGVVGELHIGGAGLARGYLNRDGLTRERFVPNPFAESPDAWLYRSGDLGRWRPDGTIELLGRRDDQVKVRGVRVEPREVEAVLAAHPGVGEVAVLVTGSGPAERQLVAVIVPADAVVDGGDLRRYAAQRLPDVMVPRIVLRRDPLPRGTTGKLDRPALAGQTPPAAPQERPVAPRDAVELQLVQIWEALFPHTEVGVTDDFFDLGGHSLLATRAIARVREAFGTELPVSTLIQERSIERLASLLRHRRRPVSPVIRMQPHGDGSPFVCIHAMSGTVFCYLELAHALGTERPFYALEAPGLRSGEPMLDRIEDMADAYVELLRGEQPAGPYLLGGWSMGGIVAFEMARRLQAAGQEVAFLAVLDARPTLPGGGNGQAERSEVLHRFATHLGLQPEDLTVTAEEFWQLTAEDQLACVLQQAQATKLLPADVGVEDLRRQLELFTHNLRALHRYVPRSYPGRITLLETAAGADAAAAWEPLAGGGMIRHAVPGDHDTMLRTPSVDAVADRLRACLAEVGLVTA